MRISDWSSDVCSSDLLQLAPDLLDGLLSGRLGLPPALTRPLDSLLDSLGLDATPLGDIGLSVLGAGVLGTKSQSFFAQTTLHATDWLDLTLGGRYQEEKRFLIKSQTGVRTPNGNGSITLLKFPLASDSVSNFSPNATLRSEEHTSELQSLMRIQYDVFCL